MNTIVSTLSRAVLGRFIRTRLIKEIKGWENLPKKGNFILASNHLSHMDWLLSGYICTPRKFTFIGQVDQYTGFKGLLRDAVYWCASVIPVNRKNDESKREAISTAVKLLRRGYRIVIYPEGGRAYDGIMREFKPGVGKLHLDSGVPVLPAAFHGTNELLPPHGKMKIKRIVKVAIGKPIDFPNEREMAQKLDCNSEQYRKLCAEVTKKIEEEVRKLMSELKAA